MSTLSRQTIAKGRHEIVFRTVFGKLRLDRRRLYHCDGDPRQPAGTLSPLAELLKELTSPELFYLESLAPPSPPTRRSFRTMATTPEITDHQHGHYGISGESVGEHPHGQAATNVLEPARRAPAAPSSSKGSQSRTARNVPALVFGMRIETDTAGRLAA